MTGTYHLDDRRIIRFTGADAKSFLQNVMSNDIETLRPEKILYSCLLTPQGQYLHDFFVVQHVGGYLVDIAAEQVDDFLRRLKVFKLRAQVTMTVDEDHKVYAGNEGFADPRHAGLGNRLYTLDKCDALPRDVYEDRAISLGIPASRALKPEKDILADVNLDLLHAVGWDKGCFIGQEVTARMKYRGLAKRRLAIISGTMLTVGGLLQSANGEAGEIRQISSDATQGLAVIKLSAIGGELVDSKQTTVTAKMPEYVES